MKLYSWNVNGFRAVCQKPDWAWFKQCQGDVIALQETKAEFSQIPEAERELENYKSFWLASQVKKGYSGVAVFVKNQTSTALENIPLNNGEELPLQAWQGEGRLIYLEFPKFHFLNVYFPNGQMSEERLQYKLGYYNAFLEYAEALRKTKPIVVCGDFNTAHHPIDLARPKQNEETSGFLPIERAWLDKFVEHGYVDTFRLINGDKPDHYSWWSYRMRARERNVGWRIDYFFVSKELKGAVKNAWIESEIMGSDHCPIGLELDI